MRCPYCGGINQDRAAFCVNCGRDLTRPLPPNNQPQRQQHYQPARPGAAPQGRPVNAPNQQAYRAPAPPAQPQQSHAPAPQRPQAQPQTSAGTGRRQPTVSSPAQEPANPLQSVFSAPPAPEPPGPFPPHTMPQFEALLTAGSQAYTVVENEVGDGKKQMLSIAYGACAGWQQAATLLKALKEQQNAKCDTVIIQGVIPSQPNASSGFTNGQLQFDRNVRLGGSVSNRYIVETGNGFASDSVRFVLNE